MYKIFIFMALFFISLSTFSMDDFSSHKNILTEDLRGHQYTSENTPDELIIPKRGYPPFLAKPKKQSPSPRALSKPLPSVSPWKEHLPEEMIPHWGEKNPPRLRVNFIEGNDLPASIDFIHPAFSFRPYYWTFGAQTFRRTNVSGRHFNCFFNSLGLRRYVEARKLLQNLFDENVRALLANEILNIAHNEMIENNHILSEEIKNALGFFEFKTRQDDIDRRRQENNNNRQKLDEEEERLKRDIFTAASRENVLVKYIRNHIGTRDRMMEVSRNVDNDINSFIAIDAIAYVNNWGLIVYRPAVSQGYENTRLDIFHKFIPPHATKIVHVFHSGMHYQHLNPVSGPEFGKIGPRKPPSFGY